MSLPSGGVVSEDDVAATSDPLEESLTAIVHLDQNYGFTDDEVREILRAEWSRCDAPAMVNDELLALFRRAGYVSDCDERPTGELTIYRGTFGDDPRNGLSWTLDASKAKWFARRGARGLAAGPPTVWQATVDAAAILGYFVERDEAEIIADPATLRGVVDRR